MIGADKKKLNILRVMICAVVLCAFMWALMYGYAEGIEIIAEKLEEINPNKTGDMKNTMWLIEHIMFILPVCILLIFQLVLYAIWKERDATKLHRECFISLLAAFLFTYAILLPAVIIFSKQAPAQIDEETGKELPTLMVKTGEWFIWQFMIFLAPLLYRKVSADNTHNLQKAEDEEIEENS